MVLTRESGKECCLAISSTLVLNESKGIPRLTSQTLFSSISSKYTCLIEFFAVSKSRSWLQRYKHFLKLSNSTWMMPTLLKNSLFFSHNYQYFSICIFWTKNEKLFKFLVKESYMVTLECMVFSAPLNISPSRNITFCPKSGETFANFKVFQWK